MRLSFKPLVLPVFAAGITWWMLSLCGCTDLSLEDPQAFGYETDPIAIYNADWGVLPLPNNLLNPAQQAGYVSIPGVPVPESIPTTVALPVVDADAVAVAADLGYTAEPYNVVADSDLTLALKKGMNRLDGFQVNFVPEIPLSKKIDLDSLVPFDGSNTQEANFFFLDITDPSAPVAVDPAKYLRVFNFRLSESMPYYLSLRLTTEDLMFGEVTLDFPQGRSYLIVITGFNDSGLKSSEGTPFQPDPFFLVFAEEDRYVDEGLAYIAPDGSSRNNVLGSKEEIQTAEGARQITDYGLTLWESLVGNTHKRNEVVTAFHFSVAKNPMPTYFVLNPLDTLGGAYNLAPQPSDGVKADLTDPENVTYAFDLADADCSPQIEFELSREIQEDTVTSETVKLYKKTTDGLTETAATPALSTEDGVVKITLTPDAALDAESEYVVAANHGLLDKETGLPAGDQTYFGLTRVDTPLVDETGMWLSPNLDSRMDALFLLKNNPLGSDIQDMNQLSTGNLAEATATLSGVLSALEQFRLHYADSIDALVENGFLAEREDLVMFWTFTTGTCGK